MGLQNCLGKVDILYIIRHYLCVFRTFCADNILWRKNLNFEVIWDKFTPSLQQVQEILALFSPSGRCADILNNLEHLNEQWDHSKQSGTPE